MNIPITKENEGLYKRFKEIVTIQGRQQNKTLSTIELEQKAAAMFEAKYGSGDR